MFINSLDDSLSDSEILYAQDNLRILSGLYGILKLRWNITI